MRHCPIECRMLNICMSQGRRQLGAALCSRRFHQTHTLDEFRRRFTMLQYHTLVATGWLPCHGMNERLSRRKITVAQEASCFPEVRVGGAVAGVEQGCHVVKMTVPPTLTSGKQDA